MALTTLIVLAVLRGSGVSPNLFHLISLILAAGLGLAYGYSSSMRLLDSGERRTLHAVLICSISILTVFALLMISDVPVLRDRSDRDAGCLLQLPVPADADAARKMKNVPLLRSFRQPG